MSEFKKGDRVRLLKNESGIMAGMTGVLTTPTQFARFIPDEITGAEEFGDCEKGFAVCEYNLELITSYTPITPKVGEKYRVVKEGIMNVHGKIVALQIPGDTFIVTLIDLDGDIWSDDFWFHKSTLTTEYLELVEEEGEVVTGLGLYAGASYSPVTVSVDWASQHCSFHKEEPIKKTLIQKTMNAFKKALLSADTKSLIKAGYMDSETLELTSKGQDALNFIVYEKYQKELVTAAEVEVAEQEAKKK